jgi:hypothetical protein
VQRNRGVSTTWRRRLRRESAGRRVLRRNAGIPGATVEELYAIGFHAAVGTFDVGNRALTPEQALAEAGLRAQTARTFAQVSTTTASGATFADGCR